MRSVSKWNEPFRSQDSVDANYEEALQPALADNCKDKQRRIPHTNELFYSVREFVQGK